MKYELDFKTENKSEEIIEFIKIILKNKSKNYLK